MLKKPSFLLSSCGNVHCLYSLQPHSIHTPAPSRSRQTNSSETQAHLRHCYATVRSGDSAHGHSDHFNWPKTSARRLPTPYEILCTEKGTAYSKKKFYELAKIYHPDRHGQSESTVLSGAVRMERYRLIVTAHEILSDPSKRQAYDATGAGWNGRPEHGAPKYDWGQNNETRWSGFDRNDSPFRNATWEDWERWYMRDKAKQEPVYFSNGGFLMLVIAVVFLGGFGQSVRVGDYSNIFQRQVEMVHDDASKALRKRKTESTGFGNRDERLQSFLQSRDPRGYGIADPYEEGYRKILPGPEVCMSESTNTYLVGKGKSRLLIDTGDGKPSWSKAFTATLESERFSISHALLTHWHPDHVGGIQDLRSACPEISVYKGKLHEVPNSNVDESISNNQIFKTEGATLRAFHCPGHTTDHMAFILEEENAMFTGDNVLGHGTAVFEDLTVYLNSLHTMRKQFSGRAYPGHGAVIENGQAKIDEYISHRQQREDEVLHALKGFDHAVSPMEIVKVVYRDVPENLHDAAAKGVRQILEKLEREGKVKREGGEGKGKWRVGSGKAAL